MLANSYVCRSYRGQTGKRPFCRPAPPFWIGLRRFEIRRACVQDTKYCVMIYIVICRVLYRKLLALVRFIINFHCRSGFSLCSSKHFSAVGCSLLMKDWISQLFICSKQNIWWFLLNYLIKSLGGEYIITSKENFLTSPKDSMDNLYLQKCYSRSNLFLNKFL